MRTKLLIVNILMILLALPTYAQEYTAETDSLWRIAKNDTTSIDNREIALNALSVGKRIDTAITVLNEMLDHPMASGNYSQVGIHRSIGNMYLKKSKNYKALTSFLKAEQIMKKKFGNDTKHLKQKSALLSSIGRTYLRFGNEQQAIRYQLESIEINKQNKNLRGAATTYYNLGVLHANNKDFEEAINYQEKAYLYADTLDNVYIKTFILNNLAASYLGQRKFSKVDSLLDVADKLDRTNKEALKYDILHTRAISRIKKEDFQSALSIYKEIEAHFLKIDDLNSLNYYYESIGFVYKELNQFDKGISYCLKGYEAYQESPLLQYESVKCLEDAYEKKGDYKSALKFSKIKAALQDSLFNQEKTKEMTKLTMQHEFKEEKAQTEAAHLLTLQRQRSIQYGLAGGLGLLGLVLFFAYRAYRIKQKANLKISEQNAQLDQLNQTKDRIFGIIGHDLKKPAIAFRGIAKKVNYLLKKQDYDRLLSLGESIEKDANSLNILTDNLLKWALLQRDILPNDASQAKIQPIVEEVFELFDRVATEKNIHLTTDIQPHQKVLADKNALSTIIRNLVDNAVKFTEEGGKVNVSSVETKEGILLSISDSGLGMSEDIIKDLFLLKKEKTTSGTNDEKGTGLGLHLVGELIKQIKGSVEVKSQLGVGTEFRIRLPLAV